MIDGNRWILALVAMAGSLLLGEVAGRLVRASMGRADRPAEVREAARPVSHVLFWACATLGIFVAVASTSRHAFEEIPDRILSLLPEVLLAGIILITGAAVSIVLVAASAQAAVRVSGSRHLGIERAIRVSIAGISLVLALSQLGVDTAVLSIALAIVVGAPVMTVALLTAFGGRRVAADVAAGRVLRTHLRVGYHLSCATATARIDGTIVAVHPVSVEVEGVDGVRTQVPLHCLLEEPYSVSPVRSSV